MRLTVTPTELFLADGKASITEEALKETERASDTLGLLTGLMEERKIEALREGLRSSGYGNRTAASAAKITLLKDELEAAELEEALQAVQAGMKAKKAPERNDHGAGGEQPKQQSPVKKGRDTIEVFIATQTQEGNADFQLEVAAIPPETGQNPNVVDLVRHVTDLRMFPADWGLAKETIPEFDQLIEKHQEGFLQPVYVHHQPDRLWNRV